jgi:hypothetical protein
MGKRGNEDRSLSDSTIARPQKVASGLHRCMEAIALSIANVGKSRVIGVSWKMEGAEQNGNSCSCMVKVKEPGSDY